MVDERRCAPIIRSDSLGDLLRLVDGLPGIRPLIGEVFQVIVVLDASYVQSEIRWRVGSRNDAHARTSLHEAMASGVILASAPTFLEQEIEKYIPEIAEQTGASVDRVREEWDLLRALIRFYEPLPDDLPAICVDSKDMAYIHTLEQLNAHFVCTNDKDFTAMGVPVMPAGFDRVLRDYARATSALLTVKFGSTFVIICGFELISALATLVIDAIRRLPPAVKILMAASLGLALLHPVSRTKLFALLKNVWERLQSSKPALISLSSEALHTLANVVQLAKATERTIAHTLPSKGKLSVVASACQVCMKAGEPLPVVEIARRIQNSGYKTRSRNFSAYVRRVLRNDSRFVPNGDGLWALRSRAAAA
jgi:hypothetical protein